MSRRWWVWPLLVAAMVDLALVARFQWSSGLAVDRAILRSVRGTGCEQAVLIRGSGADQLFVIDTWRKDGGVVSGTARASFFPGAGLTPQSRASIEAGGEVDLSMLKRPVPMPLSDGLMANRYLQQVGAAASWLTGPCLPFANPFQSHLRLVGSMAAAGVDVTVYHGRVRYARGSFQLFSSAQVWVGVRADGRMGFEVLRQTGGTVAGGSTSGAADVTVVTLFQYPSTHLGKTFADQGTVKREIFYQSEYRRVLDTMGQVVGNGLGMST